MDLCEMSALSAAAAIRAGEITSVELVRACLDRIAEREERVRAWTYLDPEYALEQAEDADRRLRRKLAPGPLHGIPVGVKDIFDTADMPTENGTIIHAGRRPAEDATAVERLRQAGAVILGKTVTTELAVFAPGKTTNPHDARRTPGGSSSGSAAAVAAGMVPLALGTQTNGSVLRPASYCGVYGYKPTHGSISRHGVLMQSRILDQVGVFARTVEDAALAAQPLFGYDGWDPDVRCGAGPDLGGDGAVGSSAPPRLAFVKTPLWENAAERTREAFRSLCDRLGGSVREVALPDLFDQAIQWHRTIMESDLAVSYEAEYDQGRGPLSDVLREMIARGQTYRAVEYNKALAGIGALNRELEKIFACFDAILTPATAAEAPMGLESTGSPMFCTIWTLCGLPAISLPILRGEEGMPLGAQLVAARGADRRLLQTSRWLADSAA